MKYVVTARYWDKELIDVFGDQDIIHELSDSDVVFYIKKFGRASIEDIKLKPELLKLEFENDYD